MSARKQVMVRVEPEIASKWVEIAEARGLSLNTFLIDAANAAANGSALGGFAATATAAGATTATATLSAPAGQPTDFATDPLLAFDLAVSTTPALTGLRKWVDPVSLREEFAKLITS